MAILITLFALALLMVAAYRGMSVILFAPICALLAVALSLGADAILPMYSQVFMKKMVVFVQLYFPVFLLGAVFGKLMEISGAASSLSAGIVKMVGPRHAILAVVLACAALTYGGISLFVVAFAIYPFAAVLFKEADIPKRLIPGAIALGSFSFTMDALPGTPQIQNIIPTTFFGTDIYAAPVLGICGAIFVLIGGITYLQWRRRRAVDGYGQGHRNEPELREKEEQRMPVYRAVAPLILVAVVNYVGLHWIHAHYGASFDMAPWGIADDGKIDISKTASVWAIECALSIGVVATLIAGGRGMWKTINQSLQTAVMGSLMASINTASEYGFGGVIAALPGFAAVKHLVGGSLSNPLLNEAISVNVLAGITGSASGGLSLALAAFGKQFQAAAETARIDPQVLHRVAAMASGGMDTLPHNGAVITLLLITGLTHRESYKDIFAITCLKTLAVFVVIAIYQMTGFY